MRLFATIIFAALLCATSTAQTLKSLMYNATNGQVVYPVANALRFESENLQSVYFTDIVAQNIEAGIGTNSVAFGALGIDFAGVAAATTRTNLGLGATNNVTFAKIIVASGTTNTPLNTLGDIVVHNGVDEFHISTGGFTYYNGTNTGGYFDAETRSLGGGAWTWDSPFTFGNVTNAAISRTNLGIPLDALTNTSNVTMMRALAGSTNTNEPFSGSISVVGTNNTNTLVFSNGILQSVQ